MGRRGPAKQPSAIDALKGNPGRRTGRGEPRFTDGEIVCPDWLGEAGQAKWQERLPQLLAVPGLMKPVFADMLALYCEAFEEFLDAKAEVARDGATCISEKGGAYQHPAVGRKNKAIQRMRQFGAMFGMSPSDAASLSLGDQEDPKQDDPFLRLMRSRGLN